MSRPSANAYALLGNAPEDNNDEFDEPLVHPSVPVQQVQVSALVLLKILKHAKEQNPTAATGALLGMDLNGTLEVTQCYPNLTKSRRGNNPNHDDEEDETDLDENYQIEMMKCLRQVNADANTVGWYHAAPLAHFLNHSWVAIMADFQANLPQSIVLEYDTSSTAAGRLSLRAFRLTNAFFNVYKGKPRSALNTEAVSTSGLLERGLLHEFPVIIRNSHLVSAFMYSNALNGPALAAPLPGSARDHFVTKHATALLDTLDDFAQEQARYAGWNRVYSREKGRMEAAVNRKRHEDPAQAEILLKQMTGRLPSEPSKLDSLLLAQQVSQHCNEVDAYLAPAVMAVELARCAAPEEQQQLQ